MATIYTHKHANSCYRKQLQERPLKPRFNLIVRYREVSPRFSLRYCDERERSDIVDFLAASDLAVTGVRIVERSSSPDTATENGRSTAVVGSEIKENADTNTVEVLLQHQPDSGEPAELNISEESDGTRKMFALAGPWLDSLTHGNVIVFDELHDSLHPELVRSLVGQFHDSGLKPGTLARFPTSDGPRTSNPTTIA